MFVSKVTAMDLSVYIGLEVRVRLATDPQTLTHGVIKFNEGRKLFYIKDESTKFPIFFDPSELIYIELVGA